MNKKITGNYESRAALEVAVLRNIEAGLTMKAIAEHAGVSRFVIFTIKHPGYQDETKPRYSKKYYQTNKETIIERKRIRRIAEAEHKRLHTGDIVNALKPYNAPKPAVVVEDMATLERRMAHERRHRKENFMDIRERATINSYN